MAKSKIGTALSPVHVHSGGDVGVTALPRWDGRSRDLLRHNLGEKRKRSPWRAHAGSWPSAKNLAGLCRVGLEAMPPGQPSS